MAFVRRLLGKGRRTPKSKDANGAPTNMSAEETTSQMTGLSLNGASQDGEVATFALS